MESSCDGRQGNVFGKDNRSDLLGELRVNDERRKEYSKKVAQEADGSTH